MIARWANNEEVGRSRVFEALHAGLTVQLIATPRPNLMTCRRDEAVPAVTDRNTENYDFIPVVAGEGSEADGIIGLFHAAQFRTASRSQDTIGAHLLPLSEEFLIGADASILDFIKDADSKPCRMVVSGPRITGLVSLSDLQRLPVRVTLFALITGFEIAMSEAIRRNFPKDEGWMDLLSDGRKNAIRQEIAKSKKDNGFVDALLFTQFSDKADIVRKSLQLAQSKTTLQDRFTEIRKLRDNLAHANEYAASPSEAATVCRVVRHLLELKDEIAGAERAN